MARLTDILNSILRENIARPAGTFSELLNIGGSKVLGALDPNRTAEEYYNVNPNKILTQEELNMFRADPLKATGKAVSTTAANALSIVSGPAQAARLLPLIQRGGVSALSKQGLGILGRVAAERLPVGAMAGLGASKEGEEAKSTMIGAGLAGISPIFDVSGGRLARGIGEVTQPILGKLSNKLKGMSQDMRISALRKGVGAVPTAKEGKYGAIRDVLEYADKSPKKYKLSDAENVFEFGRDLINKNWKTANSLTSEFDKTGMRIAKSKITGPLEEKLLNISQPQLRKPIELVLASIEDATGGADTLSATDILKLKREWGALGNWNQASSADDIAVADVFENLYLKANDVLEEVLDGAGLKGFREANKALNVANTAQNWARRGMANRSGAPVWTDMTADAAIFGSLVGGAPGAAAGAVASKLGQRYGESITAGGLSALSKLLQGRNVTETPMSSGAKGLLRNVGIGQLAGQELTPITTQPTAESVTTVEIDQPDFVRNLEKKYMGAGTQEIGSQDMGIEGMGTQDVNPLNLILVQGILSGQISGAEANAVLSLLGMQLPEAKKMTATEKNRLYELNTAEADLQNISQILDTYKGESGPIFGGIAKHVPGTQARKINAELGRLTQSIATGLERGKLSDQDREFYKTITPQVDDTASEREYKINSLLSAIRRNKTAFQDVYGGGYSETDALSEMLGL